MRVFYKWTNEVGIEGSSFIVLSWLIGLKLPNREKSVAIKTLDPHKGPLLKSELMVLDKFYGEMLNNWESLSYLKKTACIAYILARETARRFSEFVSLEMTDLYRDDEGFSFVKLHARKRVKRGEDYKGHHRISDWIYDFVMLYITEMQNIREELKTNMLFVHISKKILSPEESYVTSSGQMTQYTSYLVNEACLPNRLFFRQNAISLENLSNPQNKKYRINLNSSRIRDTFGTSMAAMGVPMSLVAARMGHECAQTTKKYYVVLNPAMVKEYLSETTGEIFTKMSDYFFNRVVETLTTSKRVYILDDPESTPFGGCKANYCNHDPLIACYGCPRFQPLKSSVHKRNLTRLKKKREKIIKSVENSKGNTEGKHMDLMMQNIDVAIAVCENIVDQCESKIKVA